LLLTDNGRHVELLFCRNRSDDPAGISDVLMQLTNGHWFSMTAGKADPTQQQAQQPSACFRDCAGGFYQL